MASGWFLGPPGDLRELIVPEPDVTVEQVRLGSARQALSGARTVDVTGHRQRFEFTFEHLEPEEYAWLEALHTRVIPGPLRLISPLKRNRLSMQASHAMAWGVYTLGIQTNVSYPVTSRDFPDEVDLQGRSSYFEQSSTNSYWIFDGNRNGAPVFSGEDIVCSVYLRSDTAQTLEYRIIFRDAAGLDIDSETVTGDWSIGTSWNRFEETVEVPDDAATVAFSLANPDGVFIDLYIACAQIEEGTVATDWQIGGGGTVVAVDQLTTTSPLFPRYNCTLTLLEL
jgi:hypothetical protein